ncbi:MAG: hypothetical protein H8D34_32180, partial [Chloroflexi bacterium]|nr:hypothetical protein [Chloroflexota bacterium]
PPPPPPPPPPVPGSITIIKDTQPDDAQDFAYSGTLGAFDLDDYADATLSNTAIFNNLTPGTFTVTEGVVSGWVLDDLSCVDPDGGSSTSVGTRTATIDVDAGENVTCTFTNQQSFNLPYVNIGSAPDGITTSIPSGTSVILNINVVVNGNPSWDLVYYELPNDNGSCSPPPTDNAITMDWVEIQIGDGTNWYSAFYWGDGSVDPNSSIAPLGLPESDTRSICATDLYNSNGVALELDGVIPAGTYPYVKILAPSGDSDGVVEVDAIVPLP